MRIITFDLMMMDSNITTDVLKVCVGIIIISIIIRMANPSLLGEIQPDEFILNLFKFIGYGFLAGYIYLIIMGNDFEKIDVLTFFTFLLACFEATHNFMLTIGTWIASFIRLCYYALFKPDKYY